ncbi:hypothetical protein E3A20_24190, partial [Planctomyces bekefii]
QAALYSLQSVTHWTPQFMARETLLP